MAFPPCPKCQDKRQFDAMPISQAAFVVAKSNHATEFYANRYECTRNAEHTWSNFWAIRSSLKRAGY
jgi:hypothetical protein